MHLLAGDIGGTHTRLIYAEIHNHVQHVLAEKSYPSADYNDLQSVLDIFLTEHVISNTIDAACFAVAGPVKGNVASITNLPWVISQQALCETLQTPRIKLINDFVAAAYGISVLDESDIQILQQGNNTSQNQDAAIIGAGTGLGASHLVWSNNHYQIYPSEAGHAGFSPENELQCELLSWMLKQHDYVSLEMLLSGRGLIKIYQFLNEVKDIAESLSVNAAMKQSDPASVISDYALTGRDELCQKTLDCFIDIYGSAASNIALHYYPIGEVYIAGGIAPKIKNKLLGSRFIEAFRNKGLMSSNMEQITIKLICQEKTGLYGALSHAQSL